MSDPVCTRNGSRRMVLSLLLESTSRERAIDECGVPTKHRRVIPLLVS